MDFSFLNPPNTQEEQSAMADALRRQEQAGQVALLSGVRSLQPYGQSALQGVAQSKQNQLHLAQMVAAAKEQALDNARQDKALAESSRHNLWNEQHPQQSVVFGNLPGAAPGAAPEGFAFNPKTGKLEPIGITQPPKGGAGAGGPSAELTPEALDALAAQYHASAELPQVGIGREGSARRVKIINRALELFPQTDLAGTKATYGAGTKSLAKQTIAADAMNAFEETALANLNTFLDQAKKVADVGSPLFNAPARKFSEMVAGNPEMAAFNAARLTTVQEISKVLSGSLGGAAVSDSARHEASALLGPDASIAQIQKAAEILVRDMANRKTAVAKGIEETRGRISGRPVAAEPAPLADAQHPVKYLISPDKKLRVPVFADGTKGKEEPNL